MTKTIKGFKLVKLRKNGTIGPLFINRRQIIPSGKWLEAESHPTKGYALRPGWHITGKPEAPHLSKEGRVWMEVEFKDYEVIQRPECQGGKWYIAQQMKVLKEYKPKNNL